MRHAAHSQHINPRPQLPEGPAALTRDIIDKFSSPRGGALFALSGAMLLIGAVGLAMRFDSGTDVRQEWGYYAAIFVFLLSTAQAAPILSVATRLTKGYWRKPLVRVAELFTVVGVLNFLLLLPLLGLLPAVSEHVTFWVNWEGAAQGALVVTMLALAIAGLGLLYTSARPDMAAVRDMAAGKRDSLSARLAGNWGGTPHQWKVMKQGITYFGVFYLMMLVGMHFMVSVEFAIQLVPGWRDPIFPAYHAIGALQAGLATLVLTLGILRAVGGYKDYLALDQFWNPAKLLLSFSLLWFYFWWSGFIVFWYGRTPAEEGVLQAVVFGPFFGSFVVSFLCNFVTPLLLLMWNPIRVSIAGPVIASIVILVGNFMDRVRIYGSSFAVEPGGHVVKEIPATYFPGLPDVLVGIGAVGAVIFLFMLAMRIVPVMSLWELKEGQLLSETRTLHKNEVLVLGKPE